MDVGIHSIDLIRWFAGEFDQLEYHGNGSSTAVESDAQLDFSLANGAKGRVVASRTRNLKQKLTLTGTEGFLEVGLWYPGLSIRCAKGKAFQNYIAWTPPFHADLLSIVFRGPAAKFVAAIRGEEEVLVNGQKAWPQSTSFAALIMEQFARPRLWPKLQGSKNDFPTHARALRAFSL